MKPTKLVLLGGIIIALLGAVIIGAWAVNILVSPQKNSIEALALELGKARTCNEATSLVRRILDQQDSNAWDVVAAYARGSPLRAFQRQHGLFLMHDASDGAFYRVVSGGTGTRISVDDARVSSEEKIELGQAVQQSVKRLTQVTKFTLGNPTIVFAGFYELPRYFQPDTRANNWVSFVVKVQDRDEYYKIDFEFADQVLLQMVFGNAPDTDLRRWRADQSWPWKGNAK